VFDRKHVDGVAFATRRLNLATLTRYFDATSLSSIAVI
jgi:hypothetical protein